MTDTVYVLNHELDGSPITTVGDGLRLDPERLTSDVEEFEAAIEAGALERAVELYGGAFLDGLYIKEAYDFEEWVRAERERFGRAYDQALEQLAERDLASERPAAAVEWLHRLRAAEPDNGRVVVRLMEALAASGDRAGALQAAEAHAVRMRQEFDAEPEAAVVELARRLREEASVWEEESVRVVPERSRKSSRTILGGVVAVGLVFLTGLYVVQRNPGSELTAEEILAADADPGIAVLPFTVNDAALEGRGWWTSCP